MTEGFVSDITDDDTVMDEPDATLSIDITKLDPQQALTVAQAAGLDGQDDFVVGRLMQGKDVDSDCCKPAEFHLPMEAAITALIELSVIQNDAVEGTNGDE